jgi:hypothetical protein
VASEEWIGGSEEDAIVWTDIPDGNGDVEKNMGAYNNLIVTLLVTTAPATGTLSVRIQHSSDYGLARSTKHWQTLLLFDAVDAGTTLPHLQTLSEEVFHGYIKVQSICSVADQTVAFDVDIEGK